MPPPRPKRKRPAIIFYGLPCLLVLVNLALIWALFAGQKAPRPNILIITVDALRADYVGPRAGLPSLTPHMDALARPGARFTQAISQGSWTPPTMHSLFTSVFPSSHGVFAFGQRLPDKMATVVGVARAAGYKTHMISAHETTDMMPSFCGSFESWWQMKQPRCASLTDRALGWIRGNQAGPFLLWLHYMSTHESLTGNPALGVKPDKLTPALRQTVVSTYSDGVKSADREVGRLMAELTSRGLREDTVVVVTADHGQELCEKGICMDHGSRLVDSLIRVPLLVSYPRKLKESVVISSQVQAIDVAPTVCKLASLQVPAGFKGADLSPLLDGADGPPRAAISEHKERKGDPLIGPLVSYMVSVRLDGFKLIENSSPRDVRAVIFSLVEDPLELKVITNKEHPRFRPLILALERWRSATPAVPEKKQDPMDTEDIRRLKSLGYIEGGE